MRSLARRKIYFGLAILSLLTACASHNYAPVKDLEKPRRVTWGSHKVRQGETLYAIAWRYGRDYRELAKINEIKRPYLLQPGQVISLRTAQARTRPDKPSSSPKTKVAKKKVLVSTKKPKTKLAAASIVRWDWPVRGKVVKSYSKWGDNKGIDIAANWGSDVRSAADGVVVYAGSGLIGYGNLVIIKHNKNYLSAYAHNRKILVAEQKKVKVGEKIAEIGPMGRGKKAILHFEIRKNGKPVNPIQYLPKIRS